jgi:hypothetical protein
MCGFGNGGRCLKSKLDLADSRLVVESGFGKGTKADVRIRKWWSNSALADSRLVVESGFGKGTKADVRCWKWWSCFGKGELWEIKV